MVAVGVWLPMLLLGCERRQVGISPHPEPATHRFEAAALGKARPLTLTVLTMPYRSFALRLGPHRVSARSKLETKARGQKTIAQKLSLKADGAGHFSANKTTDEQHGYELIWTGKWLYSRLRYQSFSRRRPQDQLEPTRLADKQYALLAAYIRLLEPFIQLSRGDTKKIAGREAVLVTLSRRAQPLEGGRAAAPLAAKRWRRTIDVEKLEGRVLLDTKTGAPLLVKLKAIWTFAMPKAAAPKTGIPSELSSERGRTSLVFDQQILEVGKRQQIAAPAAHELVDVRRRRLEIERQMITGERPLDPGWRSRWGDIERLK